MLSEKKINESKIFNFGIEIELIFRNNSELFFSELKKVFYKDTGYVLKDEKILNQFEFEVGINEDIDFLANEIILLKNYLKDYAKKKGEEVYFTGKPFEHMPGNAMHVNVSLLDEFGHNLFAKNNELESEVLLFAVGGLCHTMLRSMSIFIPNEDGYARLVAKNHAPTTISWGGNNRTVAIRVPTTNPIMRRIEHRVPSADADPKKVMKEIKQGILLGIEEKISPPNKIYGDASEEQYNLPKLPKTLEEAVKYAL